MIATADDDGVEILTRDSRLGQLRAGLSLFAREDLPRVGRDEARGDIRSDLEPLLELPASIALNVMHRESDKPDRQYPDPKAQS